jgi:cytochrome oxidase Cu insertion factor (SCO1/SenC/PrrC family)
MTTQQNDQSQWMSGHSRLNRRAIPNIALIDHQGRTYRFYENLVREKRILLSFTSITHDVALPVTARVAEVCRRLDEMNDASTSVYTVTVDPERDHPALFAAFARRYRASERWLFLSGQEADTELLRSAFFVERGVPSSGAGPQLFRRADILHLGGHHGVADCSMGLLRYGNEALDLWGGVPARASVEDIIMRLTWIREDTHRPTRRRRGGPNIPIAT